MNEPITLILITGLIGEAHQDPAKAHPLTYAKQGYATIKATAETVGLQLA
jgi:hypothetical protein